MTSLFPQRPNLTPTDGDRRIQQALDEISPKHPIFNLPPEQKKMIAARNIVGDYYQAALAEDPLNNPDVLEALREIK